MTDRQRTADQLADSPLFGYRLSDIFDGGLQLRICQPWMSAAPGGYAIDVAMAAQLWPLHEVFAWESAAARDGTVVLDAGTTHLTIAEAHVVIDGSAEDMSLFDCLLSGFAESACKRHGASDTIAMLRRLPEVVRRRYVPHEHALISCLRLSERVHQPGRAPAT